MNVDGLESCKRCPFAMVIETPVEVNKVFSCEKCKSEFCRYECSLFLLNVMFHFRICKNDWKPHIGRPCSEMKAVEDEQEVKRIKLLVWVYSSELYFSGKKTFLWPSSEYATNVKLNSPRTTDVIRCSLFPNVEIFWFR